MSEFVYCLLLYRDVLCVNVVQFQSHTQVKDVDEQACTNRILEEGE